MNQNGSRFKKTRKSAKHAGLNITPVAGVLITKSMMKKGVRGVSRKAHNFKRNRGVIGCFLAHRKLLEGIAADKADKSEATLIFEDDIVFPSNFLESLETIKGQLPNDWDLVFLGNTSSRRGKQVSKNIFEVNGKIFPWGTWAYIVKNSSVKTRLLPELSIMKEAIDHQYCLMSKTANIYRVYPNIVKLNKTTDSNIIKVSNKEV
jgi:GR25 family glycosyltransferase involved in LPS biosynthesis